MFLVVTKRFMARVVLILFLLSPCFAFGNPDDRFLEAQQVEVFDYLTADRQMLSYKDRHACLGPPLNMDAPHGGGYKLFKHLLPYLNQFQEITLPVERSEYYITLLGPGQHQVFNFGEGWLMHKGKIAFMSEEDYSAMKKLIDWHLGLDADYKELPKHVVLHGAKPIGTIRYSMKEFKERPELTKSKALAEAHLLAATIEKKRLESSIDYGNNPEKYSDQLQELDSVIASGGQSKLVGAFSSEEELSADQGGSVDKKERLVESASVNGHDSNEVNNQNVLVSTIAQAGTLTAQSDQQKRLEKSEVPTSPFSSGAISKSETEAEPIHIQPERDPSKTNRNWAFYLFLLVTLSGVAYLSVRMVRGNTKTTRR